MVGLDLAGSPRRTTGFCLLTGRWQTRTAALHEDAEILEHIERARPNVVVVDAPLSLPRGRPSLEARGPPHFRQCDLELRRLGIPFFPITLGPMRMLTARGMALQRELAARGFRVMEGYPGGAQDILGIRRKQAGVERLRRALVRAGFQGDVERRGLTHDELDGVTCAWVGRMLLEGAALVIGDREEGEIVLPPLPPRALRAPARGRTPAGLRARVRH